MVFTYILELNNGKNYTGMTKDIAIRLKQHRRGESKSTKGHRPVRLIWLQGNVTRETARYLEMKIKRTGAKRFMKTYPMGNLGIGVINALNGELRMERWIDGYQLRAAQT